MVTVKVNGAGYRVASEWSDITISQAGALLDITLPDVLRKIYALYRNEEGLKDEEIMERIEQAGESISFEEQYKGLPKFYSRVLEVLSDIPGDVLNRTDVISISTIYRTYLSQFIDGLWVRPAYEHREITFFDFEDRRYYLPEDREVFGTVVPMVNITALEFTESADLMIQATRMGTDRDFRRIANLISILCRPKNGDERETYNEVVCLARAEKFLELKMDVAWDVFFSLITPLIIAGQYVQICSLEEMIEESKADTLTKSTLSGGMGKFFSSQGRTSGLSDTLKHYLSMNFSRRFRTVSQN